MISKINNESKFCFWIFVLEIIYLQWFQSRFLIDYYPRKIKCNRLILY